MAKGKEKRPSWTEEDKVEVMAWLCSHIATSSIGMATILAYAEEFPETVKHVPSKALVFRWMHEQEEFRDQYARAKEMQMDYLSEEMLEIADDATNDYMDIQRGENTVTVVDKEHISRSRVRIDTRKWLMGKLRPDRFGDKVEVNNRHSGGVSNSWTVEFVNADPENLAQPGGANASLEGQQTT